MLTVLLMFLNIKVSAELLSSCLGQNTIQTIKTITKAIDYFGVSFSFSFMFSRSVCAKNSSEGFYSFSLKLLLRSILEHNCCVSFPTQQKVLKFEKIP